MISILQLLPQMITALLTVFAMTSNAVAANSCEAAVSGSVWSSACFEISPLGWQVKKSYRKNMPINRFGNAAIYISDRRELVVVDKDGVVTAPNVYLSGDYDNLGPESGLVRFSVPSSGYVNMAVGKCGYIDGVSLRILVPPKFDHCSSFREGTAIACNNCTKYCVGSQDCQDSVFVDGTSFELDRSGRIVRTHMSITLDSICGEKGTARVRKGEARDYVECQEDSESPFRIEK